MHSRRCIREEEIFDILKDCHDGPCGRHFADHWTGHKIVIEPFERWALDFIDPKNPSSNQKTYILVATEYVTKWVEAEALPRATEDSVIHFIFQLFLRYGLPREENGQVESTNKVIEAILTKTIASHRHDWATRLLEALWAYRKTWRNTMGYSPYQLVFGKEPIFPIEFEIQTLRIAQEVGLDLSKAQINRLHQINELDEIRLTSLQHTALIQQQRAKWHHALIKKKIFHEGDWALLYDSRFQDFLGKL
eukprot:PITA_12043